MDWTHSHERTMADADDGRDREFGVVLRPLQPPTALKRMPIRFEQLRPSVPN